MSGNQSAPPKNRNSEVTVNINPKIYPLDVIYSAAYVFLDNFYIIIDGDPKDKVIVKILPKKGFSSEDIEKRFNNELINYVFYKKQVEKNGDIRKAIIQRALVTAELSGESTANINQKQWSGIEEFQSSDADFIDDPEGIAIPWEEKFGKKDSKGKKGGEKNGC